MTALQDRLDEARVDIQTLVQNYPIGTRDFMATVLWERAMSQLQRRRPPIDWAYANYYDLLLDLAEPVVAPIFSDDALGVMEARHCYSNCYEAVLEYGGSYTYVEGLAQAQFLPLRHAWLVNDEGQIVDPTWANLDVPTGYRATYFGVRFTDDFLLGHAIRTGWHSFFENDWMNDHQILKHGLQLNDAGLAHALGGNL